MPKKILFIEDEYDVAKLLVKRFRAAGYAVVIAPDGALAIQAAHQDKPDLIVLDLMLPGGGGKTVIERLKVSTHTKSIPIIVLTAMQDETYQKQIMAYDIEAYIQKPYEFPELLDQVKKVIGEP